MDRNVSKPDKTWETFHGPNLGYVMDMYEKYKNDSDEVDPDLKEWFEAHGAPVAKPLNGHAPDVSPEMSTTMMHKIAKAIKLADNIRRFGHVLADVNPLESPGEESPLLQPEENGLDEEDLTSMPADMLCEDAPNHVENGYDAIMHLKQMYTKSIAFEFDQVHDLEERGWLNRMVESGDIYEDLSEERRKHLLEQLTATEKFEQFLHKNFVGQKRFSVEGLDTMIPMLEEMVQYFMHEGADHVMLGMAHRGRLSTLAHVLGKPYNLIFSEFKHAPNKETVPSEGATTLNYGWTGDVKYHLGANRKINQASTHTTVSVANNPSHLEFVNPVVAGYARAAQEDREKTGFPDVEANKAGAILVHGDAAFPGEGIVAETLNLSRLKGYQIGGTLHIIANNLLGFTTESHDSRSTTYASDLAKGFEIPIIHVNADDPDACIAAVHLACEYRSRFHKDFLIDLVGYRRYGHNEGDEPAATQPKLYETIRSHDTATTIYADKLQQEGILEEEQATAMQKEMQEKLEKEYEKVSGSYTPGETEPPEVIEKGLPDVETSVDYDTLKQMNEELLEQPEGFTAFRNVKRILNRREKAFTEGKIDWGHAEALAFASIISDGTPIRMTGQDSERGTFNHRHLILHDAATGENHSPMHTLSTANASFALHNSPLSEAAVVGFEYGYNVQAPDTLVLWEAQYGDFNNAAQVHFDQFISAGRAKWGQRSGIVLLLPHGYEGAGPEHSSARLERFLSLAAENNWNVVNATNTSQYFHLLRRQAATLEMDEVRPLVLMTPKSLLRNQTIADSHEAFTDGKFKAVIEDPKTSGNKEEDVDTIIFCSGKVSIDLHETIDEDVDVSHLHIARVEELYPYPKEDIKVVLSKYKNVKHVKWVQEEPKNMGAWSYIEPYLRETLPADIDIEYIGRRRRSSPSEGDPNVHKNEQQRIINDALGLQEGRDD
ncbi:2-oxoglutarate dehydrogenase E1 component [Salicibibacter kimchii]|uniref:2-oxoglutarate dehydrogenase E1 component n=1 Tax=Salicibibacter kimchii TaxID=2099786 RepID=A0A345BVG9_9BACI|nr:2-oxoglutarate dehydrogenase E1 component [Salicibibacter kimchii]AXF54950.1 2-oxoglutarate dehydrogenase E1 component [Salicibibacter kimchii]